MRNSRRTASAWSGELSFGSPEADFKMSSLRDQVHAVHTAAGPSWSTSISYGAPFSDFAGQESVHSEEATNNSDQVSSQEWSKHYSFASPESDFTADPESPLRKWIEENQQWSEELSFASPESDFKSTDVADRVSEHKEQGTEWSDELSFASPESDFKSTDVADRVSAHKEQATEWSNELSFSSPESDFKATDVADRVSAHKEQATEWSNELSFSSPESDFKATDVADRVSAHKEQATEWTNELSFSSPESDFKAAFVAERVSAYEEHGAEWSEELSFASPESDFKASLVADRLSQEQGTEWSDELSFASPESDFKALLVADRLSAHEGQVSEQEATDIALARVAAHPFLHLPLETPESAFGSVPMHHLMEDHHAQKLEPLPSTVEQALVDERPIVITDAQAPFNIVDVNDSWVGLCEFSKAEAKSSSLRLIQGDDTDRDALRHVMASLLHGEEATAIVTNYTKSGRKFYNQLRAGPIRDPQTDKVTHFVGILREVMEESEAAGYQSMSA